MVATPGCHALGPPSVPSLGSSVGGAFYSNLGSTHIVVSSGTGSCGDLVADDPVEVSGHDSGDHIVATSITVR